MLRNNRSGVGHGIGSYLGVHESECLRSSLLNVSQFGSELINPTPDPMYSRSIAFEPGHITTIEPGYYKEGEWGIRIESVLLCKQVEVNLSFLNSRVLGGLSNGTDSRGRRTISFP